MMFVYELFIMLAALAGVFLSIPVLRDEVATRRRIVERGINGRLRNVATTLILLILTLPLSLFVVVITCAYRLDTLAAPQHFVPSTLRLVLVAFLIYVIERVKANRRKYPHADRPKVMEEIGNINAAVAAKEQAEQ